MLLIRRFEERLINLHEASAFAGHYHLCIGQEATAIAVTAHLRRDDSLHTTHRNHGHLLARGADPARMFAEILGRADGYNGGRGGTLHLASRELGVSFTSAMVGGGVLHALGTAYAAKRRESGAVAVAFFGDGTFEEGAVYEAFNLAALWRLPLLFVCENNGLPVDDRQAGDFPSAALAVRALPVAAEAFGIPAVSLDGTNLLAMDEHVRATLATMRDGGGPAFIEARTVRWPGSRPIWPVLPGGSLQIDWLAGADPAPEIASWFNASDPILVFARSAAARDAVSTTELHEIDEQVLRRIDAAVVNALASPPPDAATATDHVFAKASWST